MLYSWTNENNHYNDAITFLREYNIAHTCDDYMGKKYIYLFGGNEIVQSIMRRLTIEHGTIVEARNDMMEFLKIRNIVENYITGFHTWVKLPEKLDLSISDMTMLMFMIAESGRASSFHDQIQAELDEYLAIDRFNTPI